MRWAMMGEDPFTILLKQQVNNFKWWWFRENRANLIEYTIKFHWPHKYINNNRMRFEETLYGQYTYISVWGAQKVLFCRLNNGKSMIKLFMRSHWCWEIDFYHKHVFIRWMMLVKNDWIFGMMYNLHIYIRKDIKIFFLKIVLVLTNFNLL